jgi:PEP-CTERM motif
MSVSFARVIRSTVSSAAGLLAVAAILLVAAGSASAGNWVGYMNVFNNSAGAQGSYIFGSAWGVPELKTTITNSNVGTIAGDQLVLEPNYNVYTDSLTATDADRAFWTNSTDGGVTAGPAGNKWMDASTFEETASLAVPSYTLSGTVTANTLNTGLYTAIAFIKVLDPLAGYATLLNDSVTLPASGPFIVTSNLSLYQGKLLQVGFSMNGLNANPVNAASNGSVSVAITAVPEPSTFALLAIGSCGAVALRRRVRRATA